MARRAFLHIGTPKSGTTYLQSLWWQHRDALAERGLLLPGANADEQFHAAAVIRANHDVIATMGPRQLAAWDRVLAESRQWPGDVLLSQEQLVEASAADAAHAVRRLGEAADEVHVVVTARDLVRQVPSAWQQRIKHGSPTSLRRFTDRVAKDEPDFNFWTHQDVPRILERWGAGLDPDHVHVVVLPPPGAAKDLLWNRMCDLLGVDPGGLALDAPVANETLSAAQIAFHRLVNTHLRNAHLDVARSRRVKAFMEPRLVADDSPAGRLVLPEDTHAWAVARGSTMADELAAAPWHVVGDLDDLRPDAERGAGVDPDAVPDSETVEVALRLIAARLLEHHPPDGPPEGSSRPVRPPYFGAEPAASPDIRRNHSPSTRSAATSVLRSAVRRLLGRLLRGQRGTNAQ